MCGAGWQYSTQSPRCSSVHADSRSVHIDSNSAFRSGTAPVFHSVTAFVYYVVSDAVSRTVTWVLVECVH